MIWDKIEHFTPAEFDTPGEPGTGVNMDPDFMQRLDAARRIAGVPFAITPGGGYRTTKYNADLLKRNPHASPRSLHKDGRAADIAVPNGDAHRRGVIVGALIAAGFERIGLAHSFVHVDDGTEDDGRRTPAIWIYK